MSSIKEVIVVEGQNDINKITSCLQAEVIKTNGTHLSKKLLDHLKELNQIRGIIVMTDDDYPGRWIRSQIVEAVGDCKHAFIDKKDSKTDKKVGIEHASCQHIMKALENVITFESGVQTLPFETFQQVGLQGQAESATLRKQLTNRLGLPIMNAKRLYKTLNMMRISPEELNQLIKEPQK